MSLHLPHDQGSFGVSFNDVSRDVVFYTTTARFVAWMGAFSQERQGLWLTKDDLKDVSSWSSPPLMILCDIHSKLLTQYDFKEVEVSFVRDESSASTADVDVIPSQHKVTVQILRHWQPFIDLKLIYADSRHAEQLRLRSQQHIVTIRATHYTGCSASTDDPGA